ncbi:MAG: hypothetical protein CL610_28750 [Anaerolineaceae bacterium]|nr:hypothetical protein [Anaerolineaceae bacterium]
MNDPLATNPPESQAPRPLAETFASLPPDWPDDPLPAVRTAIKRLNQKVVVLDDDPTGTQTVHDVPVLTEWSTPALTAEFRDPCPAVFVLTNSRSLTASAARACNLEIGRHLAAASARTGRPYVVASRSDSTLRGHFPTETDALAAASGKAVDAVLIVPAFMAGGRYTIADTHYVAEGDQLIPAGQTPFARDATFGYAASNLRAWVSEKTGGQVRPEAVTAISLDEIRLGGPDRVTERLLTMKDQTYCVINAVNERDLSVVALGVVQAEAQGKVLLYRTAASFAAARAGIALRPLLTAADMNLTSSGGGLVVVGSYVPKSSQQLEHLLKQPDIAGIEVHVQRLLDDASAEIARVIEAVDTRLRLHQNVVIFTSRGLITGADADSSLAIGNRVSAGLVAIVQGLHETPRFLIAKGGITSSDLATKALGVRRALVMGQILPGVPVWQLGAESRQPGMAYVVFPGNVGGPDALAAVVDKFR